MRPLDPSLYPDRDPAAVTRQYEDWLLGEYGLNPGSIYATGPPSWDVDRLRQLVGMGLNGINLGYVNAPLEPELDQAGHWRRLEGQLEAMAAWLPTAEAAGARDLCYVYCFDERPADQLEVARLEDEVTVKRLKLRGARAELIAENPDYSPIVLDLRREPLVIEGIAVGVIRPSL